MQTLPRLYVALLWRLNGYMWIIQRQVQLVGALSCKALSKIDLGNETIRFIKKWQEVALDR